MLLENICSEVDPSSEGCCELGCRGLFQTDASTESGEQRPQRIVHWFASIGDNCEHASENDQVQIAAATGQCVHAGASFQLWHSRSVRLDGEQCQVSTWAQQHSGQSGGEASENPPCVESALWQNKVLGDESGPSFVDGLHADYRQRS